MVLAACLIDVILAFAGQQDIAIYFTANVIIYLIITVLYIYFSPRTRRTLSFVSVVLLASFIIVAVFKAVEVLSTT
jgi:hypothetical protein